LSPADRVVVDWRISEYELVDDNEAGHVDKPVVLFSESYTACILTTQVQINYCNETIEGASSRNGNRDTNKSFCIVYIRSCKENKRVLAT